MSNNVAAIKYELDGDTDGMIVSRLIIALLWTLPIAAVFAFSGWALVRLDKKCNRYMHWQLLNQARKHRWNEPRP